VKATSIVHLLTFLLLSVTLLRADFMDGQVPDLALNARQRPSVNTRSVAVDPMTKKVFVSDPFSHRVLRYGSSEALQSNAAPEAVIGQLDTFANSPATTSRTLDGPTGITVDGGGRLWVADSDNNRILRFDNASTLASGAIASGVLGQDDFVTKTSGLAANRVNTPTALAVDSSGRLWVVDGENQRVLRWNNAAALANGAAATAVLGQAAFTTQAIGTTASTLSSPTALALEESGGSLVRLWVGDWANRRVLAYNNPATKANGAAADKVLGQTNFTTGTSNPLSASTILGVGALVIQGNDLWVADTSSRRVVRFANAGSKANGAVADSLLGQSSFTATVASTTAEYLRGPRGLAVDGPRLWIADFTNDRVVRHENAATKSGVVAPDSTLAEEGFGDTESASVQGLATDPATGKLFVSDSGRHRVLRYASVAALHAGSQPEAVLGQPDFQTTTAGTTASTLYSPRGIHVDRLGNLWVADAGNNRVLRFAGAATLASGAAAVQVFGSTSFTAAGNGIGADGLNLPMGLVTEWELTGGRFVNILRLWVADTGNNRVLRFDAPLTAGNGAAAVGVLGQFNFSNAASGLSSTTMNSPGALAVDGTGRLWVADRSNKRVLRHDSAATKANGAAANGVLLQPGFTSNSFASDPVSIAVTPQGRLFISEYSQKRVRWIDGAATKANGNYVDGQLGAHDPTAYPGNPHWRVLNGPTAICLEPGSSRLWVADTNVLKRFTPVVLSRITGYGIDSMNRFQLTILGSGGETYQIRSSTDLIDWSTIEQTSTVPSSGTTVMNWTSAAPISGPRKFFRLQLP
jgi:sugar lactone lactonase YvrE